MLRAVNARRSHSEKQHVTPGSDCQYICGTRGISHRTTRTIAKNNRNSYCVAPKLEIESGNNPSFGMTPIRTKGARGKKMATVNYDKMPLKELLDHEARIAKAIVAARRNEFSNARQKVIAMAESLGYKIEELAGAARTGKRGNSSKVAVKYRNKDNPEETWTGRGRQPKWLAAKLAKGSKLSDFAV